MPIGLGASLGIGGGRAATSSGAPAGGATPYIIYEITNSGSDFVLRSSGTVDYTVDWGDGNSETSTSNALSHTYSAGTYTINISSDVVYRPSFLSSGDEDQITSVEIKDGINLGTTLIYAWRGAQNMTTFVASGATATVENFTAAFQSCSGLTSFPLIDASSGTDFESAWYLCSGLTSFPALDLSGGLIFKQAWRTCNSLTSFPAVDMSSGTNFYYTWNGCNSLTSFPAVDMSSGLDFTQAWTSCSSLSSFLAVNMSSGTNFYFTWYACSSLTSFPAANMSSGTNFGYAWRNCSSLTSFLAANMSSGTTFISAWQDAALTTFPANMFDTTGTLAASAFGNAWLNCALTAQSIENILVSLDTNGASSISLGINGGTNAAKSTWSAAAVAAYDTLITRSWTIAFNA